MCSINHICNADGKKKTIDSLLEGSKRHIWHRSLSADQVRLIRGNDAGIKRAETIDFMPQQDVSRNEKVTYATMVCHCRPLKNKNSY